MHGMTDKIVNQDRATAYPQSLPRKKLKLLRMKMMGEQTAAYQVESVVGEWKIERVGDYGVIFPRQMRAHIVEQSYIERDSASSQLLPHDFGNLSQTCGYFQHRKMLDSGGLGYPFNHRLCCRDAAEPAIDAANNL
jgi:hypothetical protein